MTAHRSRLVVVLVCLALLLAGLAFAAWPAGLLLVGGRLLDSAAAGIALPGLAALVAAAALPTNLARGRRGLLAMLLACGLLAGGARAADWLLGDGQTDTVLPAGPTGCRVIVREGQFFKTGSGTIFVVPRGGVLARRVAGYTTDEAGMPAASGEYVLTWHGDGARLDLSAGQFGHITPDSFAIDCARGSAQAVTVPPAEPTPVAPSATAPGTPDCAGQTDGIAVAWTRVDAAGPRRFVAAGVRNCGGAGVELPAQPDLSVRDADQHDVAVARDRDADERPLTLVPGDVAYLDLSWLSNGRCEIGATSITWTFTGSSYATPPDCFQLGDGAGARGESAAVRVIWSTQPGR